MFFLPASSSSFWCYSAAAAAIGFAVGRDWQSVPVGTTYVAAGTERNRRIVARLRASVGHYHPPTPLWSYNPHLATILPSGGAPVVDYSRQRVVVEDGDDVHIDWFPRRPARCSDPSAVAIILLFPGLGQQSSCPGPRAFAATVAAAGHLCGIVNPTRKWHPTRTLEAERVLAAAAAEWGAERIMVVGMSGSSTILSHVLAATVPPAHLPQLGAVLCCFVTDYGAALDRLETGSAEGRAYSRLLAAKLRALMGPDAPTTTCPEGCLLSELDAVATRGFGSAAALRAAMQTSELLARIPVPCLIVQPTDDPLQTLSDPAQQRQSARAATAANPNLVLVEPSHGAHLGFCCCGGGEQKEYQYHPAQLALALLDELRRRQSSGSSSGKRKRVD